MNMGAYLSQFGTQHFSGYTRTLPRILYSFSMICVYTWIPSVLRPG